jgi:hypothetical protein
MSDTAFSFWAKTDRDMQENSAIAKKSLNEVILIDFLFH